MSVLFRLATPYAPGPIAVIDLYGDEAGEGPDVVDVLQQLTGADRWPVGSIRFCRFGAIDEGIVAVLGPDRAQLMPHGGLRVLQRLGEALIELDCVPAPTQVDPELEYPEAESRDEALMLAAMARAASPLALELLPSQPERWAAYRTALAQRCADDVEPIEMIRRRSVRLNHLLAPPSVVVVGLPNVGKSTLTNALAGRSTSIAADLMGTTRDYVGVQLDLDGLVVWWYDTPGRPEQQSDGSLPDPITGDAVAISDRIIADADLLIAAADHQGIWPELPECRADVGPYDLRVLLKSDRVKGWAPQADVSVSVKKALGLPGLTHAIRQRLVPDADLEHPGPWLFDERLTENQT
ncbi:MAG: GTP-binding protein [Planctomycetes bacterium]|nr:GTP-binding protein [Planctomycetota bacterium]NOG54807.1 GTP-binding protein [Planctomycetota bacterium]